MDREDRRDVLAFDLSDEVNSGPFETTGKPKNSQRNFKTLPALDDFDSLIKSQFRTELPLKLRRALDHHLLHAFSEDLTKRATHSLHLEQPEMSALSPLAPWQSTTLIIVAAALPLGLWLVPHLTALIVLSLALTYFLASMVFKTVLVLASLLCRTKSPPVSSRTPVVTIMLPVRNEPSALPSLVASLEKLDYPAEKLDLKFLVEEKDASTKKALELLDLPDQFEILSIPESQPQTKPKAMNFALPFARGEIIGIYDAEDDPEPDQIRKAVAALDAADASTVCVQCRLNHYRATETWLSRMASAEYSLWFDMLLKGLSVLKLPIPLGGTSLFIKLTALREVGGWDPNNVTEDADLGLRLARRGWRSEVIDSTTWEEPPVRFDQWCGQRSRWIKGFMVTWLVHMRQPRRMLKDLGWRNALAINIMLLDGFVAFLIQPLFLLALIYMVCFGTAPWGAFFDPVITTLLGVSFGMGQLVVVVAAFLAVRRRFGFWRAIWAPGLWFYWQCASLPAYRALYEMFGKRSWWNKTEHGLSQAARERRDAALSKS